MKSLRRALLVLVSVCSVGFSLAFVGGDTARTSAAFNADRYIEHVKFLASDALEGRRPGTPGIEEASVYIAYHFMRDGLKPAGVNSTYFQPWELHGRKQLSPEEARLEVAGVDGSFAVNSDWATMPFSKTDSVAGPLAFAGYGIEYSVEPPKSDETRDEPAASKTADSEAGYDDFAGFDAAGKVLMIFRYEPRAADPNAKFGGKTTSVHSLFSRKAKVAAEHGAKALLIVNPPDRDSDGDGKPDEDALYKWSEREAGATYDLPMAQITQAAAERLLRAANMPDLTTLQTRLEKDRKSLSQDLHAGDKPMTVSLTPGLRTVEARNVIGLLEGTDLKDEYIVIGAHYDHLGMSSPMRGGPPQIHNGADDNASGTSGVIELARVLSTGPRLRRSILFMTFSAEEMGLLGSDYFVKHPTVPLSQVKAMLNFDMIGRLSLDKFTISGLDTAREFPGLVEKYAKEFGIKYKPMVSSNDPFFGASDHYSFFKKKIPVIFPFTGTHKQYHQPDDDWDLIDADGATRILGMFSNIAIDLANMGEGPMLTNPQEREEVAARIIGESPKPAGDRAAAEGQTRAPARGDAASSDAPPARRRPRVRLGIGPSTETYAGDVKGVGVESVAEGGIAAKAGVHEGDVITKIRGHAVTDMNTYMAALDDAKDGEDFEIVVSRGGKPITLKAKVVMPRPQTSPE